MTPNWATAVITGLGRLLIPYTIHDSSRQRGTGGGLGRRGVGMGAGATMHDDDANSTERNSDYCGVCKRSGKLLCCDGCDSSFHLKCVKLKSTPKGDFHCPPCKQRLVMAQYIHQKKVASMQDVVVPEKNEEPQQATVVKK